MPVLITYEIPFSQVEAEIKAGRLIIEGQLNEIVDDILKYINELQTYTGNSNPTRPAGSTYVRTFTLLNASETERTSTKLPNVSGEWRVNLGQARYGEYVRGTRQQQAPIHRGRWRDKDEVEKMAQEKANQIAQEHLK